jgi:HAD superfamily hydrolase (TIGR01509 family)
VPRTEIVLPGRFRAAVFDFDGLLVDSEPAWARAEAALLMRRGESMTDADRIATVGRSIDDSVAAYGDRLGIPADEWPALRAELVALAQEAYLAGVTVRDGAAALVEALRSALRLGLASNTDRSLVSPALMATPFASAFEVVVTSDDVVNPKPAPDLYVLACRRLGVRPADAVAFEDSPAGVRSAHMAGLTVIAAPHHPDPAFALADAVVDSLAAVRVDTHRAS